MTPCDELLERLDAAVGDALPAELAEHVAGCSACTLAVERARGLAEGGLTIKAVRAPEALKDRLKSLTRLQPACEQAIDLVGAALDGEVSEDQRSRLVEHLRACPSCRATWEAFATLRETGAGTRASARLRAALALPPRQRLELRRRQKRFFDLRLATAAAYLLAALTVVLVSNPATVARASSQGLDRVAVYAQAAVENRVSSYAGRVMDALRSAEGWAIDRAGEIWTSVRGVFGGSHANQDAPARVVEGGKGGRS
ncbi:MAG TPA: zf-HC2 domain-containing protein [Thermoanaerobaculaceae bacterium]|nr:zf-HC2 domain-containing protein [Thermoanaerobaculaceae bacterium]